MGGWPSTLAPRSFPRATPVRAGQTCGSAPEARELGKRWLLPSGPPAPALGTPQLRARPPPLAWALGVPACDRHVGQQVFLEPAAPALPSQPPSSTGPHFLMTQGHPGIFVFALGTMWRPSLSVLDRLSLPLRPRPCRLSLVIWLSLGIDGGHDMWRWGSQTLGSNLGPSDRRFIHLQSGGRYQDLPGRGTGGWIVASAACPGHRQPPGLERLPHANGLLAHPAVRQTRHGAGREPRRPPQLPRCLAARGVLESGSLSPVRWIADGGRTLLGRKREPELHAPPSGARLPG